MSAIQQAFDKMNKHRAVAKDKGNFGELVVLEVMKGYQQMRDDTTLIHSYTYKYASDRQGNNYAGNIYRDQSTGEFKALHGTSSTHDEIDILCITPYRVIVIEAKARGGTWDIDDLWCKQNSTPVDKSPIAQSEKHARHLYHSLYEYLPDGNPNYIVPMTVFVDKATVRDHRTAENKYYIPASIVNILKSKIQNVDTPLRYMLDTEAINKRLMSIGRGQVFK